VHLTSYAPLFAHAEGWQWTPDLIWFDNLKAYGTPNYYVQKLFATNKGTNILSIRSGNENVTGQGNLYASAVWDKVTKEIVIKIVNNSDQVQSPEIQIVGAKKINRKASVIVLKSELNTVNSFDDPSKIKPEELTIELKGKMIKPGLAPYSLSVIKIKTL
jgi:alpha-L-arabinofuranosidase